MNNNIFFFNLESVVRRHELVTHYTVVGSFKRNTLCCICFHHHQRSQGVDLDSYIFICNLICNITVVVNFLYQNNLPYHQKQKYPLYEMYSNSHRTI